jgi:transposase
MPRLDAATRNIVIGRLQAGELQNAVARLYNIHRNTISRLLQWNQQSGSTADRQRSGRPSITSAVQDRYIRVFHLRKRTVTARETSSNVPGLRRISAQTVRNCLRENGLRVRRPYFGAVLRRRHWLARVRWCNRVRPWDLQNWRRVWFSNESRFMLQPRDGRTRVYRRRNERFERNCVLEVDNIGGGNVMLWGAISYARKTQLVHISDNLNVARYRDEVLTSHMLPTMNLHRDVFQRDNAGSHTARATVDFLANQNVTVLPWLSKWQDVNPIEHLWDDLDRRVQSSTSAANSARTAADSWERMGRIPQDHIHRLIESMTRRVRAVLQANVGHNIYWLWSDVIWTLCTLMNLKIWTTSVPNVSVM